MRNAADALDDMQCLGMRKAHRVEPSLVIETNGVHDECVTFIFSNRVPHISRIEILGMSSPIGKDLPHQGLILVDHYHPIARVNDFPGKRLQHDPRNPGWDAPLSWVWPSVRIGFFVLQIALLE